MKLRTLLLCARCAALITAATVCADTHAQPRIVVRGRSDVEAVAWCAERQCQLTGRIVDESGSGVPAVALAIRAGTHAPLRVTSDALGHFELGLDTQEDVTAFTVTPANDRSALDIETVVVATTAERPKSPVVLKPRDGRLDLDAREASLVIGNDEWTRAPLIELFDEQGQEIARAQMSAATIEIRIPTSRLGAPGYGALSLSASSEGAARTQTIKPVLRFRTTRVTLKAERVAEIVKFSGELTTRSREGLQGQAVTIVVDGAASRTVLSDASGRFQGVLDAKTQSNSLITVTAQHVSNAPWWIAGRSESIRLPPPPRPSAWPYVMAGAIAACAAWYTAKRSGPSRPGARAGRATTSASAVELATRTATRSNSDVRATVITRNGGQRLNAAEIALLTDDGRRARSNGLGEFEFLGLPDGTHTLRVQAPGHATLCIKLTTPHGGEWDGATIRLSTTRQVALAHYNRALSTDSKGERPNEALTPREHLARWLPRLSDDRRQRFAELTSRFEILYYSQPAPTEIDLEDIARRAGEFSGDEVDADSFDAQKDASL